MGRKKKVVDIETPSSSPKVGENVVPDLVCMLAKELHEDPTQLLGWHVYPDKVVIVGRTGMKFSKAVSNGV
jgi:hypothetical protein